MFCRYILVPACSSVAPSHQWWPVQLISKSEEQNRCSLVDLLICSCTKWSSETGMDRKHIDCCCWGAAVICPVKDCFYFISFKKKIKGTMLKYSVKLSQNGVLVITTAEWQRKCLCPSNLFVSWVITTSDNDKTLAFLEIFLAFLYHVWC